VNDVVKTLCAALEPDYVVLGGGNVKKLKTMPPKCRLGDNANAFRGGFRLWEQTGTLAPSVTADSSASATTTNQSAKSAAPMTTSNSAQGSSPAWQALAAHYTKFKDTHLRQLFADDPARAEKLSLDAIGLHLDYSKNRITAETMRLLRQLADEAKLAD